MNNQSDNFVDELPWYRYGWPWFLISIPLISITLGCTMLYLALQANNSLVVDDYYKQGKAINLRIERDQKASLLGLGASVYPSVEGLVVELRRSRPLSLPDGLHNQAVAFEKDFRYPAQLTVDWVHVTQAEHDGNARAQSIGAGKYIATETRLPESGKFRLHVQPGEQASWRLVGPLQGFSSERAFEINAPVADQVFNRSLMK